MTLIKIALILFIAFPALAASDKEPVNLCTGAASCSNATILYFGRDVRLEAAVDDDTGCPETASYSIQGQNTGGVNWHVVAILSTATGMISSGSLDPSQWYPTWRAVPSDTTGCTSLEVNLWVTRN